jgi:hypothetical protein
MYNSEINHIAEVYQVKLKGNTSLRNISVGAEMLEMLLPFKNLMKKQLSQKGYNVKFIPFRNIVSLYYNEFIAGVPNSPYQPVNYFEFENNPLFKFSASDNVNGEVTSFKNGSYFLQIKEVVSNIIETLKNAKKKKDYLVSSGSSNFETAMDHAELQQAAAVEQVQNDLTKKDQGNKPLTIKAFSDVIIIFVVIALVLYVVE